ncbi:MAG: ABC transporter ATP-binding protein [Bacteroidia bacterium]
MSNNNFVIKVENLGKQYRLGQVGTGTISHDLNRVWHKIRGKEDPYLKVGDVNDRSAKGGSDLVWALKNINFEVKQGEVLGIIGKNGAGKSTLLKLLSQITAPTIGDIKIKGRIAALLEVGTGFHPELSGRENVFLNGAILGMSKQEIRSKFDEIVDFSGVEKYIDTPVKRYSSGMMVRLGFAVAAHLEPEILIVDEVLAVGDAEFQDKCIGKMKNVSSQGRTILFVSHNLATMKALCTKGLLLEKGGVVCEGKMNEVIERYIANVIKASQEGNIPENASVCNTGIAKFKRINLKDTKGSLISDIPYLSPIVLEMELLSTMNLPENTLLDVRISTLDGIELVHTMNKYNPLDQSQINKGSNIIRCEIENYLQPGKYSLSIGIHQNEGATIEFVQNIMDINVLNITSDDKKDYLFDFRLAYVRFNSKWSVKN